jgi:hypothetical protein
VDHLLSIEVIRESQRNGTWGDEPPQEEGKWEVVMRRGSSSSGSASTPATPASPVPGAAAPTTGGTKKKKKTRTIPIVDTLQRRPQQLSPIARPSPANIWDTLSSVSAYLADIAPRAQAPWFLTYLHSPDYTSAYEAVLASLQQLSLTSEVAPSSEVLDVLVSVFGPQEELEFCLAAADWDTSNAIDLMDLLADLRTWDDYEAARTSERDPYEVLAGLERPASGRVSALSSPASSRPTTPGPTAVSAPAPTRAINANRLTRPAPKEPEKPAPARVVPGSVAASTGYKPTHELLQPSNPSWAAGQALLSKRVGSPASSSSSRAWSAKGKKRAAANIMPGNIGLGVVIRPVEEEPKANGKAVANGKPGAANGKAKANGKTAAAAHFARADEWQERRKHAMHRATADFAAAPKHLRGQVIGAYRLQAREAAAEAQRHTLAGARAVLDAQRATNPNSIDLHLRTVAESTTLALEALEAWHAEGGRGPFTVITGKGLHSAGQRGVLGPAVANALRGAGWRVETHPGYLTVRGR